MRSSSREEVVEVFDALEAGYKRALDLRFDVLTTPERLSGVGEVGADAPLATRRRTRTDQPAQRTGRPDRVGRQTGPGVGQPVADHPRRSVAAHPRSRRFGRAAGVERRTLAAGAARHRRSPTQRRPRRRPCRGDPQLLAPAARLRRPRDPRTKPKRSWPAWPASTAPTNWPSWPTSSPTASTPTATSPTSTAPNAAASPSATKTSTACRRSAGTSPPKPARPSTRCSPSSPHRACATPPTTTPCVERHPVAGRHPGRHPQRRATQPRRPARRGPRAAGLR